MRSLDRYVLALVITVFLGVSGGAAAGFAVGSGNDNTPPSDTVVTDYRESTPLPGVAGDQSSDVGYSDMYQVGEQKVRTSPTASGNYPASGTTRMGENDVVASVVPPFSVSMGESAAAWVALSQRLFSVQWAGGLSATGLLMPLGRREPGWYGKHFRLGHPSKTLWREYLNFGVGGRHERSKI